MTNRQKWPLRMNLLIWTVMFFTLWNIVRMATSIAWHVTLLAYAPYPGPIYIGISGAIWAIIGCLLLWCLWRGNRWTRVIILIVSGLYAIWFWLDRLFVQAGIRANWLFSLLVTIIFLALTAVVVLDPRNRIYFERETYERES